MPRRSDARKSVLQMLFLVDQNPDADLHWIRNSIEEQLDDEVLIDFAWSLFTGVRENREAIDERITAVSDHWKIERMAPTDRNVIRIGIFEIDRIGTPAAVVLNEAVELAREFGTEHSSSFVNGILDKLASQGRSASE
ncbi:MAG: transcription antitermination factor NusB [Fuerstiella sp.]